MRHRFGLGGRRDRHRPQLPVDLVVTRVCQAAAAAADRVAQRGAGAVRGGGARWLWARRARAFLGRRPPVPARRPSLATASRTSSSGRSCCSGTSASPWATASARRASASRWPGSDLHSRTALSEARLVTGNAVLFQDLLKAAGSGAPAGQAGDRAAFLQSMRVELAERYAKVGGAVCIQEPNVKEGAGGLRDLHAVLWVGHARFGSRGLAGLHAEGWVSDARLRRRAARLRLPVPRAQRGALRDRPQDRPPDPGPAARSRREPRLQAARAGLLASEIFMRDYYRRASEIHAFCDALHGPPPGPRPAGASSRACGRVPRAAARLRGAGRRAATRAGTGRSRRAGRSDPRGVRHGAGRRGAAGRRAEARDRGSPAERDPRVPAPRARRAARFMRLLERRGRVADAVRAMHETGFLGRFFPEWARITFLVQHDFFHSYTVDEHTLKASRPSTSWPAGDPAWPASRSVFDEVKDATPALPRHAPARHRQGTGRRPRGPGRRGSRRRVAATGSALDAELAERRRCS